MKIIHSDEFFRAYVEPLRSEVEEWGAEVGFYGRDRQMAIANIKKLAGTTVSQAGLDRSSRLSHSRKRLTNIEEMQRNAKNRMQEAVGRLTGSQQPNSSRFFQRSVEGVFDVGTLILMPLRLMMLWPAAARARSRLYALEESEGSAEGLRGMAESRLTSWFERQVAKGELAADIRKGAAR